MSNAKRKHNASRDVGVQRPHGNIDGSIPSATRETRAARRMHATRNARHFAPERVKRQLGRTPKIERRPQTAETGRRIWTSAIGGGAGGEERRTTMCAILITRATLATDVDALELDYLISQREALIRQREVLATRPDGETAS